MHTYKHGRHEHGQNFLADQSVVDAIVSEVVQTAGPIVEIGPGDGSLTHPLSRLERCLTAVEVDSRQAARLAPTLPTSVTIVNTDFLGYRLPHEPHVVVGNLPFHLTTAILRRLLHAPGWTHAVLLTQWEVARRRAGIGGSSMMTAQWAPWFEFAVNRRVPRTSFCPKPGVDGGLLVMSRRERPLLGRHDRKRFQGLVHRVFTGPGRGLGQILHRARCFRTSAEARAWLARRGLRADGLPKDLRTEHWTELFAMSQTH